ncbi:hypothetical protein ACFLWB_01500 [Chloroflexota bacterium]
MVTVSGKLGTRLLIPVLVLVVTGMVISTGCQAEKRQLAPAPSPMELSSTLVPNMPLDVYVYMKQESPTSIPAKMVGAYHDINVESLAVWGVPGEDSFAFGVGLTLTNADVASNLFAEIPQAKYGWKMLSGNTIYLVRGSGTAVSSLKTAISNKDFKLFDDAKLLKAAATLPDGGTTRLAAIALARPSKELLGLIPEDAGSEGLEQVKAVLKLVRLDVVVGGLYSARQIDVAKMAETLESGGDILNLEVGMLAMVKSYLPGFVVEPAAEKFLAEAEFTEIEVGELTLYKGSRVVNEGMAIPVLVRLEGNYIFAALSGQESYERILLTSVNK